MNELYFFILYFFVYGFLGWCTEVAFAAWKTHHFVNRGFLNGPICPIYGIGVGIVVMFLTPYKSNLILLYITSIILVTALEWLTGFILEKIFHNKWWDYSDMPLNLNGYVCLLFSLIWGVACVLIVDFIHPLIHRVLAFIPLPVTIPVMTILGIAMFADLYITASGILKMNKRLETMQQIANELHDISDRLGENIYRTTISAIEKQDELIDTVSEKQDEWKEVFSERQEAFKDALVEKREDISETLENVSEALENVSETLDTVSDEVKARISDLYKRYKEYTENNDRIQKRLLNAFPKMQSRRYQEMLSEVRRRIDSYMDNKK
ncbi:hypothetical protein ABXS75_08055 [Roseburia hominis]